MTSKKEDLEDRRLLYKRLRKKKEALSIAQRVYGERACFSEIDYLLEGEGESFIREVCSKLIAKESKEVVVDIPSIPGAEERIWDAVLPYISDELWLVAFLRGGFSSFPFSISQEEAREFVLKYYTTGLPGDIILFSGESVMVFGDDADTYDVVRFHDETGYYMDEVRRLACLPSTLANK